MIPPLFEFFEAITDELLSDNSRVITRSALQASKDVSTLLDDLQNDQDANTSEEAIAKSVRSLSRHFEAKGSELPFTYDESSGRFEARDLEFLEFISEMSSIRSVGKQSQNFECTVAKRLHDRATGDIHRVGHPRQRNKTQAEFNRHLRSLGFSRPVLLGQEKDGGLDIIWVLPLGAVPHRPMVSVQCKNGLFCADEGDKSIGAGSRSLSQHGWLQHSVHVPCVLFNDYIYSGLLPKKPFNFVPLGLTDLAKATRQASITMI
jgi:hypothetical protein